MPRVERPTGRTGGSDMLREHKGLILILATFCAFAASQVTWLAVDKRALVEERHYFAAAHLSHVLRGSELGRAYRERAALSPYPPSR